MRQLNHRDALRPEKQHQRNQPQPNGYAAVRRYARHHVQVEHRDHEQRDQIPAAQRALEVYGFDGRGDRVSQGSS